MMRNEIAVGLLAPAGGVALIVGSVFLAWVVILGAPILLAIGLCAFLSGKLPGMMTATARATARATSKAKAKATATARKVARVPEFATENLDILCIKGLNREQELMQRFRTGLEELWAQAPKEHAVACSCVRKQGKTYYGILRMRTKQGHSYARVAGLSRHEVAQKCVDQVDTYKREFPIPMTERPFENAECNRNRCHLKEKSIFHNGKTLVA